MQNTEKFPCVFVEQIISLKWNLYFVLQSCKTFRNKNLHNCAISLEFFIVVSCTCAYLTIIRFDDITMIIKCIDYMYEKKRASVTSTAEYNYIQFLI